MFSRTVVIAVLLALCFCGASFAQDAGGSITGRVIDQRGAVIPGAGAVAATGGRSLGADPAVSGSPQHHAWQ